MSEDYQNDNAIIQTNISEPDAHGRAAILLVESLIHGLIERKLITVAQAVEVVDTASEVQIDACIENDTPARRQSITILQDIGSSLRRDIA